MGRGKMALSIFKKIFNNNALYARRAVRIVAFIYGLIFLFWDKFGQDLLLYEFSGRSVVLFLSAVFMFILSFDVGARRL